MSSSPPHDQKSAAKSFEKEAKSGKVGEIKDFAQKSLSGVQERRSAAEQLEASLRSGAGSR